jgi:hypothetical protein
MKAFIISDLDAVVPLAKQLEILPLEHHPIDEAEQPRRPQNPEVPLFEKIPHVSLSIKAAGLSMSPRCQVYPRCLA